MDKQKPITDVRGRILAAASNLMIQKGVKETSLKDIAHEVGISKGTLYYYYSAKEDIILDITDQHLKRVTDELFSWVEDIHNQASSEEKLKVIFEKISYAETRGRLHLYLIGEAVMDNSALQEHFRRRYEEWSRDLARGLKLILKDIKTDYEALAHLMIAALDGFVIQRTLGFGSIPTEEVAKIFSKVE